MANKELKLPNKKYAEVNISDTSGDNTNSVETLAWFTKAYADKIIDAVDFGSGGGTGGGDVTREQFNNEVQARKDGDATLTINLNKEIQDRKNADTTLQENIDTEKAERENADSTLTTNLNNEIKARTDGDKTLTTNLNKEIQDRKNADTTLQNNIDDEVSTRTTDIENVNSAIATERDARISADNSINQKLTQETTSLTTKVNKNTSDITSINRTIDEYWKTIYPVGSIYVSTSATFNPQTTWGGTWRKTAEGRCLIGANETYAIGTKGGASTHSHGAGDLKSRIGPYGDNLTINITQTSAWKSDWSYQVTKATQEQQQNNYATRVEGTTSEASNMQPYLAVNIWERTA
nr:MAG TPA: baseplate protein [Bacteriophage sp.]